MGNNKVLVKVPCRLSLSVSESLTHARARLVQVHPEGKYVVDLDKNIDSTKISTGTRVALRNDSYVLHKILPNKVDPLVSLMRVEKVPDSTYEVVGGLDKQIKEIKEVCTLAATRRRRLARASNTTATIWQSRLLTRTATILTPMASIHLSVCVCVRAHRTIVLQVIELPIKHPELFESLGIAQPKVPSLRALVSPTQAAPAHAGITGSAAVWPSWNRQDAPRSCRGAPHRLLLHSCLG